MQTVREETEVAKLFEEVKIMFQDLPSRIDRRLDPEIMYRRKRRIHPMMLEEFIHFGFKTEDPYLSFLMIISLFKEDFPWLFEVGMETYRNLKQSKSNTERKKMLRTFEEILERSLRHPIMEEFYGGSKERYMFFHELPHFFHDYMNRLLPGSNEGK
ncbi:MAG: hypothetical protein JST32_08455 [Bacteroidetes bacterium]|nr:hypothetical protein [Bacteroidota bacterium]